ncbi:MAG: SGNH/GDSL hydrolase family protein [Candidatus Omnitrophica bacterium]|nr:SGNH/GDSL hydrolase family protein [Candidatus Omnitrophota bacterium]
MSTDRTSLRKIITLLILFNLALFIIGFYIKMPSIRSEWLKGPLTNRYSAYSCENAPKVFFVSTAVFFDLYFIILLTLFSITKKKKRPNARFHSFLIIIALSSSFFITEYMLRLYMKNSQAHTWYRPHPILCWWNRPSVKNFKNYSDANVESINSRGFRYYEEVPLYKAGNEYRIFTLGNSSAFGVGVADSETFTAQLESMLRKRFGQQYRIRAVNAACPGHTTYQNLLELKTMILPLRPDIVIIANNNDAALEYVEEKERVSRNPVIRRLNIILYKSCYYLLFQRVILDLKIFYFDKFTKTTDKPKLVPRVSIDDYKANIKEMMKLADVNKFKIIFVNMPVNYATLEKFPFLKEMFYKEAYQEALLGLCAGYNRIIVDVDRGWKANEDYGLFQITYINGIRTEAHFHPSAKGHLKMAQQIYDAIIQNKLIKE